jgi:hypothetical protein
VLTLGQKMLDDQIEYKQKAISSVVNSNNGLWIIPLDGYTFGKYGASVPYRYLTLKYQILFRAQLSTTTKYIGVFSNFYNQIVKQLSAYEEGDQLYTDCEEKKTAPAIELQLGGVWFNIPASLYIGKGVIV